MRSAEPTTLRRFFTQLEQRITQFPFAGELTDEFSIHHTRDVLRMKPGDPLVIVDSCHEQAYRGKITQLSRNLLEYELLESLMPLDSVSIPHLTLGMALVPEQRWDWALQKTTELGIRTLIPLQAERTQIKVHQPEKKQSRWEAIVHSAAEQSESLFLPKIAPLQKTSDFIQADYGDVLKLLLLERGEDRLPLKAKLRDWTASQPKNSGIVAAIGPAGGWSSAEIEQFLRHGFESVSLGAKILRTETAAIALMSALAYEYDPLFSATY